MNRLASLLTAGMFFVATMGSAAAAPVLSMSRVGSGVAQVGELVSFELRLSQPADVIGAFAADIGFDAQVLGFEPAAAAGDQFGPYLGVPDVETFGTAQVFFDGILHVDQVSLLDSAALTLLQHDVHDALLAELLLARLSFRALQPGAGLLEILPDSLQFSSAAGDALAPPTVAPVEGVRVVSEPGPLALVMLSLLAIPLAQRRR